MKKLLNVWFACILLFTSLFGNIFAAYADSGGNNFDRLNVLDDLRSIENFDIAQYPFYESDRPEMHVINVVEYCYSYRANEQDNYGLYLYVYNPNGLKIETFNRNNKVQMAVRYNTSPITETSAPTDYEKFTLQFCSRSEEPDYANLFYKFKVIDHKSADGKTVLDRINSNARRYDISGIELVTYGNETATEYPITGAYALNGNLGCYGTFIFTGYAAGYGADRAAESTLNCKVSYLESVQLNVKHTFYRTKTSIQGAGYQNQIDSVYFAVPKRLFETYGKLQRIKAEWYEYKTKDIIVTSNTNFANAARPYLGKDIRNSGLSLGLIQDRKIGQMGMPGITTATWAWNKLDDTYVVPELGYLYYLFETDNIAEYDPYAAVTENGGIAGNELYDYIRSYSASYDTGKLPVKNGTISADLFTADLDESRKVDNENGKIQNGYSYYDFDADVDLQVWQSWKDGDPSFLESSRNFGFWNTLLGRIPEETGREIKPIEIIEQSHLTGTAQEISERLCVNYNDVKALKGFYNDAITVNPDDKTDEEKLVVLFRFATTDYYSANVDIQKRSTVVIGDNDLTKGQVYRAWESVFFDFDIIQLTFNRNGKYTVIPVVSSPVDIVNAVTPPAIIDNSNLPWWAYVLAVLAILVVISLLRLILIQLCNLPNWVYWIVLLAILLTIPLYLTPLTGWIYKLIKKL